MDLLKIRKQRSKLSDIAYIGLNILFAVAVLVLIRETQSVWPAVSIVLLSKWRVFAVRPRFWYANILANMVDVTVGLSYVTIAYVSTSLAVQLILTVLYILWLLCIKPRSKRLYVAIQAGVAVFTGITALSIVSYSWNVFFFTLGMSFIGYIVTRHVIGSYEEPRAVLYSLLSSLLFAEIGWISYHWLMAYPLFGIGSMQLSQLALFTLLLSFVAERAYASYHRNGQVRRVDIILPMILSGSVMVSVFIMALIFGSDAL